MKTKKRVVVALGGNALGKTLKEQMLAVKITAKAIVDLIDEGYQVIVAHGNGPQVGMINKIMNSKDSDTNEDRYMPLSMCVAMSQAYIGYDLQNSIREELLRRNYKDTSVVTLLTQVCVDADSPAFKNPSKPIGKFMTYEEAEEIKKKYGYNIKEDAGRGYRRVVPSPKPYKIVEIESIKTLVDNNQIVIACGGGGIPVVSDGIALKGTSAVIDKDFASSLLAKELDADYLIILTAVEKVSINYGKPNEKQIDSMTVDEAKEYIQNREFAPGSMLPKVQAAIDFSESKKGRKTLITLLQKAKDGINGKTGTIIYDVD